MLWCLQNFLLATHSDLLSAYAHVVYHNNAPYHSKRNLRLMCESMYGPRSKPWHTLVYESHVKAGLAISAQNSTTYTCPLYASLYSLALSLEGNLLNARIMCFSYGSGCAASVYAVDTIALPIHTLATLRILQDRRPSPVEDTISKINFLEMTHGRFGFEASLTRGRQDGAYYLNNVNVTGVRSYVLHQRERRLLVNVDGKARGLLSIELI